MLVNFLGPVALTKAVLPHMISRRTGHIVVTSSLQGMLQPKNARSAVFALLTYIYNKKKHQAPCIY